MLTALCSGLPPRHPLVFRPRDARTADSLRSLADSMKEWSSWILTFRRAYPL
jgi:hypothetical protein